MVSVVSAFYAFVRHGTDSLNLITVFRREIDSQGMLIEMATNTALSFVVLYQVCMMAFFVIKERENEALVCTVIFIVSIAYIVASYERINNLVEFESIAKDDLPFEGGP